MNKIIACSTIRPEIEALNPVYEAKFMEYGLHRQPKRLRSELQEAIDEQEEAGADRIGLGYGLCSHGTAGLNAERATLIIPRVHDCISMLMGSAQKYQQEFEKAPGTIYLSRGWIDFGGDPLSVFDEYVERVGEEMARESVEAEYKNYTRLVFIETWVDDIDEYRQNARENAEFLELDFQVQKGDPGLLRKLVNLEDDERLASFPPGRTILRHNVV